MITSTCLQTLINEQALLKVIAGIDNHDLTDVSALVKACEALNVPAIDIAANSTLISFVRPMTTAVLFASSIDPLELAAAARQGVDVVELGNYDALYKKGDYYSADEVLQLARETVTLVGRMAAVCVTIPGHLNKAAHVALAIELERLGVDLLQTEGAARLVSDVPQVKLLSDNEKFEVTRQNTLTLTSATSIPVISASGIDASNLSDALIAGACGVGIGSTIRQHGDLHVAIAQVMDAYQAHQHHSAHTAELLAAV